MIKTFVLIVFSITTIKSFSQIERKKSDNVLIQSTNSVSYRLFPTQNIWTFIKLNTRNGQMWQVQFGMKREERLVTGLNSEVLVSQDKEVNDRFTLYSTQNMYNFILLDQLDGKTWQVQWSNEPLNRGVMPIE